MEAFVPKKVFLTKGVGRHKEKLASFEEALRDAKIANFNIVPVSSIMPPHCKLVSASEGLKKLHSGQILHAVLARNATNENHRLLCAGIGMAVPKDRSLHGYISEHHSFGESDEMSGDYAEDLAAMMLSTTMGISFESDSSWDTKRQIWKMSGKIVKTTNMTQSAIAAAGVWTTVIAAAVFCE